MVPRYLKIKRNGVCPDEGKQKWSTLARRRNASKVFTNRAMRDLRLIELLGCYRHHCDSCRNTCFRCLPKAREKARANGLFVQREANWSML